MAKGRGHMHARPLAAKRKPGTDRQRPADELTGMMRNRASGNCPFRTASTCGMPLPTDCGETRRTSEAATPAAAAQPTTKSQIPSAPARAPRR